MVVVLGGCCLGSLLERRWARGMVGESSLRDGGSGAW